VPILIDGHNLIGRLVGFSLQDPDDEERLTRLLISYSARVGKKITVVFDPGDTFALPETRRRANVEVVFTSHGGSADTSIVSRVRHSQNPREWLVVTSDLGLQAKVQSLGARTRSAAEFAADLRAALSGESERKDPPLSPDQVEAWMALFKARN
jgi:predicted RNA-binding protein with PIN domain